MFSQGDYTAAMGGEDDNLPGTKSTELYIKLIQKSHLDMIDQSANERPILPSSGIFIINLFQPPFLLVVVIHDRGSKFTECNHIIISKSYSARIHQTNYSKR